MHAPDVRRVLTEELASLTTDDDRSRLLRVAVARIDAGEWGSCAACSEPIAAQRLSSLPTATHCERCDVVVLDGISSGEWHVAPVPTPFGEPAA